MKLSFSNELSKFPEKNELPKIPYYNLLKCKDSHDTTTSERKLERILIADFKVKQLH
uniref:Uncharacterized protein n=1 Tax=Rhizophora mucronata TaxID=61149 RepID=A0A2P2QP67_RHIMU